MNHGEVGVPMCAKTSPSLIKIRLKIKNLNTSPCLDNAKLQTNLSAQIGAFIIQVALTLCGFTLCDPHFVRGL